MGLFKRNKKNDNSEKKEIITKEELSEKETDSTENADAATSSNLSPELLRAIDNIIPVISNGDIKHEQYQSHSF